MQEQLYNLAFEKTILCTIIFSPELFEELAGRFNPQDFYLPAHQNIFLSMNILTQKNLPIDEEFLKKELLKLNCFDEQVMLEILSANPISNTTAYLQEVKELSKLRQLLAVTNTIKKCVIEDGASSTDTIREIENKLMLMDSNISEQQPVNMYEAIQSFDTMIIPPLIQTGIRSLDRVLCGGIESAQLVHVGGESNIGKTVLTKQILKNVSRDNKVLFFSFEMPKWKIAKQLQKSEFNKENYFIIDRQMMNTDVSDVVRMIRRMHRQHGIRFGLIDSKMKLSNNTFKGTNDVERKADIDAQLTRVCNELDMVIFLITQISGENIKNGKMSSYGSVLSDYEADMKILMIKGDQSDAVLSIEKNRQEVLYEKVPLWLNRETLEFTDIRVVETVYVSTPTYASPNNDKIEIYVQ